MENLGSDVSKTPVPRELLADLSRKLGREWKSVGRYLDLTEAELDHISADYCQNTREQIYQMLLIWKRKQGHCASYGILAKALQNSHRLDLADEMSFYYGMVEFYPDQSRQEPARNLSQEEAFRSTLVDIGRTLRTKDVRWMVFQCPEIPLSDQESIQDGAQLFVEMRRYGLLSVKRLEQLVEKLQLAEPLSLLQDFKRRYPGSNYCERFPFSN